MHINATQAAFGLPNADRFDNLPGTSLLARLHTTFYLHIQEMFDDGHDALI